jgi:hypothetical protein
MGIVDKVEQAGGWPLLKSAPAPRDSDADGMPDTWEQARHLKPQDPSDASQDRNQDGYTNIEEYVNGLFE